MVASPVVYGVLTTVLSFIVSLNIQAHPAWAIHYRSPFIKNVTFGEKDLRRLLSATMNTTETIDIEDAIFALEQLHHHFGSHFKFFVIISPHRSGSTFLKDLLQSHPEISMFDEEFQCFPIKQSGCAKKETLEEAFDRLNRISDDIHQFNGTAIGFKLMEDQILNVAGRVLTATVNVTFISHWRRNRLRTVISSWPGQTCGKGNNGCVHPIYEGEANALRHFKPSLNVSMLIPEFTRMFERQRKIMGKLRSLPSFNTKCISHYEDWVNPKTTSAQTRNIESCLGVSNLELKTTLKPIHQTQSVLATISNAQEVENALRGTTYELMLEHAKSQSAAYDHLKYFDFLDNSQTELSGIPAHANSHHGSHGKQSPRHEYQHHAARGKRKP